VYFVVQILLGSFMIVDSHCHLNILEFDKLGQNLPQTLDVAAEQGVTHGLCVSINLESFPEVLAIAKHYPNVYASVGVHPNAKVEHEPTVDELVELAADDKVIAIGETGLDYFRSQGDLTWQHNRFRTHINAALATQKPLIIHCRDAKDDTLRILAEEGANRIGGIMHCFVEDWRTAQAAMDLNFYISFSGIVTFKTAQALREVATIMPIDRMLVETDCPYLAPVPHRGKTNQPAYVKHVVDAIAELRGVAPEEIARATTDNFSRLFKIAL
jgi:TatD DNase family protein